jgi:hypothetical protein
VKVNNVELRVYYDLPATTFKFCVSELISKWKMDLEKS